MSFQTQTTLFLSFLILLCIQFCSQTASSSNTTTKCVEAERRALIRIKQGLTGVKVNEILPSWKNEDYECCKWVGVGCSNGSGRVVRLDLSPGSLGLPGGTLRATTFSPLSFEELVDLDYLDLSHIDFNGSQIPSSIANLTRLTYLGLSSNMFRGSVPQAFGYMSDLKHLDLGGNMLEGVLSQAHFRNLSKLTYLNLSFNLLSLNFSSQWAPPFRLGQIFLGSCKLGPQFPRWLRTQVTYSIIDISNSGVSDSIPEWFWNVSNFVVFMDLSKNQLYGEIGNHSPKLAPFVTIDLSSNRLNGSVPSFLLQSRYLDLSENSFSKLDLDCDFIGGFTFLNFLDISNNDLSGELQDCWSRFQILTILNLANNKLSGRISPSIGSLTSIKSLKLSKNSFTGEIPSNLMNCTELLAMDFGENSLSGTIPTWIGNSLSNLTILILRSNQLIGTMPRSLCHLSRLQILDFSLNSVTGNIPNCVANFTAMRTKDGYELFSSGLGTGNYIIALTNQDWITKTHKEKALLQWKGQIREFQSILYLVKSVDLSSNELNGEFPREIVELSELINLNFSRNNLNGEIPKEIGRMRSLDSLDLSWNHFNGRIPSTVQIDRLSALDLSYNELSGKIPEGSRIQNFPEAFSGNPELCGDPLPKKCLETEHVDVSRDLDDESGKILNAGFYIAMALGFVIAFWGVCGALIFKKSFRYAYFNLANDVGDRVFVSVAIQKAKLIRMVKG